ncbi:MAG: beta-ketoacyl synthase N-terminal-like domain-containing protein [Candidatus Omnitrophota bacterium]|nr:beta-ketoacyl synthase N-terminal-like domain-containing protein [Candidatus Omnitrophota bacterium]
MNLFKNRRVVVTGIGPLSAIGIGKEVLWKSIIEKKQGVILDKHFIGDELLESFFIYKMSGFDIHSFGIDTVALEDIKSWKAGEENLDLYYFLAAIKLALDDSKIEFNKGSQLGLVLAHENPGLEQFYSNVFKKSFKLLKNNKNLTEKEHFEALYSSCSKSAYDLQTFMFLYHVAKVFNIHGYSLFINNACTSGLYAIEAASQIIKSGKNKVVAVAAVDNPGLYRCLWLKKQGLYAEDGKIKPFAKDCNGFVCGQGGASLVLEDLEHAKKRNAKIYAEYLGGGFSLESWKVTLPNVSLNFYKDAIIQSLIQSRLKCEEVDLVNAHGVATSIIDQYEARAIREVFGNSKKRPFVNAFKPYIGHNLGGCALLELAILLIALEKDFIPPVLNCEVVNPKLKINVVRESISKRIDTVMKICCGFGGFDGAVIFRKI